MIHGTIGDVFVATPIMTIYTLFERKSLKYITINCGYWIICIAIMGGILYAWMKYYFE